jgi:hypothetical protein
MLLFGELPDKLLLEISCDDKQIYFAPMNRRGNRAGENKNQLCGLIEAGFSMTLLPLDEPRG